ncbi:MAG TPA: hypothetical protein VEX15_02500 [Nocardioidaceae bacterium]|nr:hypothetical protein [Nocardioidaceae bacterium]
MTDKRRRFVAPALALAVLLGGCSDDSDDEPATPDPPSRAGAPTIRQQPVGLDVKIARLSGHLPKAASRDLTNRLGHVVATWFEGGFLAGDYPRQRFSGYASFTPDAARLARRDAAVTSNVQFGSRWTQVVPTRQRVRLFVFAPGHRPSGASADVQLVMVGAGSGGTASELAVTGQLYLTKTASGWRIFGFDLQRSVGEPGSFAAHLRATRDKQPAEPKADDTKPKQQQKKSDDKQRRQRQEARR